MTTNCPDCLWNNAVKISVRFYKDSEQLQVLFFCKLSHLISKPLFCRLQYSLCYVNGIYGLVKHLWRTFFAKQLLKKIAERWTTEKNAIIKQGPKYISACSLSQKNRNKKNKQIKKMTGRFAKFWLLTVQSISNWL